MYIYVSTFTFLTLRNLLLRSFFSIAVSPPSLPPPKKEKNKAKKQIKCLFKHSATQTQTRPNLTPPNLTVTERKGEKRQSIENVHQAKCIIQIKTCNLNFLALQIHVACRTMKEKKNWQVS